VPFPNEPGTITRMSQAAFESDRHFQIWKYTVSQAQLLLRSVKDDDHPTRLDVLFVGVTHLELPTSFDGLRIERTGDDFRLTGRDWQSAVVALNLAHAEDEGSTSTRAQSLKARGSDRAEVPLSTRPGTTRRADAA
jgi:hypothetical protein